MSTKNLVLTILSVMLLMLVIGCAKPPQTEMDAAQAALTAAKDAEADRYLPAEFNAAQDSLNAAMAEVESQKSKFALTRNYDRAKQLLDSAVKAATAAQNNVAAKKEEVKLEAEKLIADAETALVDAKALLKKAPKGKEGREALELIQSELTSVENSMVDVKTQLANGDFLSARDKANAGLQKVNSIKEELNQAIAKKKGR